MQDCTNGRLAGSRSATADMAIYFAQGRRLRSAALWNLATHLKPSIGTDDAVEGETRFEDAAGSYDLQDTEYFLAEGRHLRNRLSGTYLINGVRAICGSLQALATCHHARRRPASR